MVLYATPATNTTTSESGFSNNHCVFDLSIYVGMDLNFPTDVRNLRTVCDVLLTQQNVVFHLLLYKKHICTISGR